MKILIFLEKYENMMTFRTTLHELKSCFIQVICLLCCQVRKRLFIAIVSFGNFCSEMPKSTLKSFCIGLANLKGKFQHSNERLLIELEFIVENTLQSNVKKLVIYDVSYKSHVINHNIFEKSSRKNQMFHKRSYLVHFRQYSIINKTEKTF